MKKIDKSIHISFYFRVADNQPAKPDALPTGHEYGYICVRVSLNGRRVNVCATGAACWKSQWQTDPKGGPGKISTLEGLSDEDVHSGNEKILEAYNAIKAIYGRLSLLPEVSADQIKEVYLVESGRRAEKQEVATVKGLLTAFVNYHKQECEQGTITKSTLQAKTNYAAIFTEFLRVRQKLTMLASDVNLTLMDDFKHYLLAQRAYKRAHAGKTMRFVKSLYKWAISRKLVGSNPVSEYVVKGAQSEFDTTHLTEAQLAQLIQFDPYALVDEEKIAEATAQMLDRERDAFVFTCLTGLHDSDYKAKVFQIIKQDGRQWLVGQRVKTTIRYELPLDPMVLRIIRKYGGIEKLPTAHNVVRNRNLKALALYAGIPVKLTTKIGRKTFADRAINEMGMDAIDVAAMLGHTDTKHLKHYARVRHKRLADKFKSLELGEAA